jgi:hypothetical protein
MFASTIRKPASLLGGNVVREHVCALMATKVHAQMIAIFARNEHFVRLLSGETGTIARYREDTTR